MIKKSLTADRDEVILFGAFLRSLRDLAVNRTPLPAQFRTNGATSNDPTTGGFAVPEKLADFLWLRVYSIGKLLPLTFGAPVVGTSVLKIPTVHEDNRADGSRYGGISLAMKGEGETIVPSSPKFGLVSFLARKLCGAVILTNELFRDASLLGDTVSRLLALKSAFKLENYILNGTGQGEPLGLIPASATIKVDAEVGQASATITTDNVLRMWSRLWVGSHNNAAWLVTPTALPQLMSLTISTGTTVVRLFDYADDGTPRLMGRPIITTEYNPVLGETGDIVLADLNQYAFISRETRLEMSEHLRFTTDELVLRYAARFDGAPLWSTPTTPLHGAETVSPFVTLVAR